MINPKLIAIAVAAVLAVGLGQQLRVWNLQKQVSSCELSASEQAAAYATARAAGLTKLAAVVQDAEEARSATRAAREAQLAEAEARVRAERELAERSATEFERRLREADQSCLQWQREVIPCPVQ